MIFQPDDILCNVHGSYTFQVGIALIGRGDDRKVFAFWTIKAQFWDGSGQARI